MLGHKIRSWIVALSLALAGTVHGQDSSKVAVPDTGSVSAPDTVRRTDLHANAQTALDVGDHRGCLSILAAMPEQQRMSARNQWLRMECLHAGFESGPDDHQLAVDFLVACSEFIRDNPLSEHVNEIRTWQQELRKVFEYDQLKYRSLNYEQLPLDQRIALGQVETFLDSRRNDDAADDQLQRLLGELADLDFPMYGGETPITLCLRKDLDHSFRTVLAFLRLHGKLEQRLKDLLLAAVRYDAPVITNDLMNSYFGDRGNELEAEMFNAALQGHSGKVLDQWFRARTNSTLNELRSWDRCAVGNPLVLAQAAFATNDTAFMRHAIILGALADSLAPMVFRSMDEGNWGMLDVLLDGNPPGEARITGGMTYLHKAMALDSPDAMKVLYHHGWFDKLAGELDDDGLPAVHYLVTRNLPRLLNEAPLLSHLNLNATDARGFALLHKIAFRPANMDLPNAVLLTKLLDSNPRMNRGKPGPLFDWTPLHYAVREDKPDLVRILLAKGANPDAKDTWERTPKDLAKELHFRDAVKAL